MCLIKDKPFPLPPPPPYEDPCLSHLFWGVVVFRHHVILGIEMISKWRLPCIVDRILKSISFPYPT